MAQIKLSHLYNFEFKRCCIFATHRKKYKNGKFNQLV